MQGIQGSTLSDFTDGLWRNNQGLVALLGLCPLLAVTTSVTNGLGLGLATLATLMTTNLIVALIRRWIRVEVRIPMFVLIIACVVTAIEQLINAHLYQLYLALGIFLPLIVTNCAVIGRAEAFASKHTPLRAVFDGVGMGVGFLIVLVVLGAMRELIGYGTLFRDAELMFGAAGAVLTVTVIDNYSGFLVAILPAGAFAGLAVLVALKQKIDAWMAEKAGRLPKSVPIDVSG